MNFSTDSNSLVTVNLLLQFHTGAQVVWMESSVRG